MVKDKELEKEIYGTKGYFNAFVKERNIKDQTVKGYRTSIKQYCLLHDKSIEELIDEAIEEEDNKEVKKYIYECNGKCNHWRL